MWYIWTGWSPCSGSTARHGYSLVIYIPHGQSGPWNVPGEQLYPKQHYLILTLHLKAISIFLNKHETLQHHALSKAQLKVLQDICEFLSYSHEVQQAVSAKKTPMLTHVLPLYEKLALLYRLTAWKLPELCGTINAAHAKLDKYLKLTCTTHVYALAMSMFAGSFYLCKNLFVCS